MAALDAEVVDPLRQVESGVSFDAEVKKSVEPFAAGVEAYGGSLVGPFAERCVPRAEPLALKAGSQDHVVLIEARDVRRIYIGAAPVQIVERAPRLAVAVLGFLFLAVVHLQDRPPAQARLDQLRLVAAGWTRC